MKTAQWKPSNTSCRLEQENYFSGKAIPYFFIGLANVLYQTYGTITVWHSYEKGISGLNLAANFTYSICRLVVMLEHIGDFLCPKAPRKSDPLVPKSFLSGSSLRKDLRRKQVFSKIFRWRLPDGHTREPVAVEVAGSFTNWEKVPLTRDSARDAWQVTLHDIRNNRTHHYMILVDGKPAYDRYNDGLAIPQGLEEERHQIMTDKAPGYLCFLPRRNNESVGEGWQKANMILCVGTTPAAQRVAVTADKEPVLALVSGASPCHESKR